MTCSAMFFAKKHEREQFFIGAVPLFPLFPLYIYKVYIKGVCSVCTAYAVCMQYAVYAL